MAFGGIFKNSGGYGIIANDSDYFVITEEATLSPSYETGDGYNAAQNGSKDGFGGYAGTVGSAPDGSNRTYYGYSISGLLDLNEPLELRNQNFYFIEIDKGDIIEYGTSMAANGGGGNWPQAIWTTKGSTVKAYAVRMRGLEPQPTLSGFGMAVFAKNAPYIPDGDVVWHQDDELVQMQGSTVFTRTQMINGTWISIPTNAESVSMTGMFASDSPAYGYFERHATNNTMRFVKNGSAPNKYPIKEMQWMKT